MGSRRNEPKARSAVAELTAMLWCAAVLLASLLLTYWGVREIYSA